VRNAISGGLVARRADGTFIRVRPRRFGKTQVSGCFMTVLDFVFVANTPVGRTGESRLSHFVMSAMCRGGRRVLI